MPQRVSPNAVVITSDAGETHLKITLELNINLNSDGVTTLTAVPKVPPQEPDDFSGFEVPEFGGNERVNFGKRVDG